VNELPAEVRFFHQAAISCGKNLLASRDARTILEAAADGDIERIRYLVSEEFVDPDTADYDRRTALHLAVCEGRMDIVECLIAELGAAHSPTDRWGRTPLDEAHASTRPEIVSLLEKQGAMRGITHQQYLENAAADLCFAAASSDCDRLERLILQNKLDVNAGDYDQRTALHLAAAEGHLTVVKHLVERLAARANVLDRWHTTPLACAREGGHEQIVKYLLAGGSSACGSESVSLTKLAL
jgi:ankyrin repeat protein